MIYPDIKQEIYYIYILLCKDDSFYIGLTNELLRRFEDHITGKYDRCYTYKRRPLRLMYYETIPILKEAVDREKQLKGWSRAKKKALIEQNFHKLQLLSECNNLSHCKYRGFRE